MSTRAQIGFYESKEQGINCPEVLIYKHCDGYPEGVIDLLTSFCKRFDKNRGLQDTEYAGAWYLYSLISEHIASMVEWKTAAGKIATHLPTDGHDFLGHGVCKEFHDDIEYFYRVHPSEILVYDVGYNSTPNRWKLINTISLKETPK